MALLVLPSDDRERVEDVVDVVVLDAVDVEEGGVKLGAQQEATLGVPAERWPGVSEVGGELG